MLAEDFLDVLAVDGFFEDFERSVMSRALTSLFRIFGRLRAQRSWFDMFHRKLDNPIDCALAFELRDRGGSVHHKHRWE